MSKWKSYSWYCGILHRIFSSDPKLQFMKLLLQIPWLLHWPHKVQWQQIKFKISSIKAVIRCNSGRLQKEWKNKSVYLTQTTFPHFLLFALATCIENLTSFSDFQISVHWDFISLLSLMGFLATNPFPITGRLLLLILVSVMQTGNIIIRQKKKIYNVNIL